jgi:hypothetical protein
MHRWRQSYDHYVQAWKIQLSAGVQMNISGVTNLDPDDFIPVPITYILASRPRPLYDDVAVSIVFPYPLPYALHPYCFPEPLTLTLDPDPVP